MNERRATQLAALRSALQDALGHRFHDPALLDRALRHPSAVRRAVDSNQRLEFFGDRVLGVIVAAMLYEHFPNADEGALAQRFTALVRREALVEVARAVSLGAALELGRGEAEGGGHDKPANLADACEAVIAALYLDGGLAAADRFVRARWHTMMIADQEPPRDPKTMLQEWAQAVHQSLPVYRTISKEGPAHAPRFRVEVRAGELDPIVASGPTKRAAEQAAARRFLAALGDDDA